MIIKVNIEAFVKARIELGWSQGALAKKANMSKSAISLIEGEKRNPLPETSKKLCDALGVEFDDIFFIDSVNKRVQETA